MQSDNVEEVTEVQSSEVVNVEDRKLPPDIGLNGGDVFRRSSAIAE